LTARSSDAATSRRWARATLPSARHPPSGVRLPNDSAGSRRRAPRGMGGTSSARRAVACENGAKRETVTDARRRSAPRAVRASTRAGRDAGAPRTDWVVNAGASHLTPASPHAPVRRLATAPSERRATRNATHLWPQPRAPARAPPRSARTAPGDARSRSEEMWGHVRARWGCGGPPRPEIRTSALSSEATLRGLWLPPGHSDTSTLRPDRDVARPAAAGNGQFLVCFHIIMTDWSPSRISGVRCPRIAVSS
jgi:hypothetical protein